jgi:hypothetical protein
MIQDLLLHHHLHRYPLLLYLVVEHRHMDQMLHLTQTTKSLFQREGAVDYFVIDIALVD